MSVRETHFRAKKQVDDFALSLTQELERAGLRTVRSFDLRSACAPLNTPCPHHSPRPCDCQLVVLLVYDWFDSPYSLAIHGSGQQCDISLQIVGQSRNAEAEESIRLLVGMAAEDCSR